MCIHMCCVRFVETSLLATHHQPHLLSLRFAAQCIPGRKHSKKHTQAFMFFKGCHIGVPNSAPPHSHVGITHSALGNSLKPKFNQQQWRRGDTIIVVDSTARLHRSKKHRRFPTRARREHAILSSTHTQTCTCIFKKWCVCIYKYTANTSHVLFTRRVWCIYN